MAVGEIVALAPATMPDPLTGRPVTRLTDENANTWYPYFTQVLFEAGQLLVCSDRDGSTQLYRLDLETSVMVQLTAVEGGVGAHQATMLPGRGQAAYIAGDRLHRVDLETGVSEELFRVPEGYRASILAPDGSGGSVTFAVCEAMAAVTYTGRQYSDFLERLYRRPSCLIFRVNTETGEPAVLWGEREWISHVIVSPVDADVVVFCHEGPWERVQRLWRLSARSGLVEKLLPYEPGLARAGHEFFTPWGEVGVQYSLRMTREASDWIHYNVLTDPDGRRPRFYRYPAGMPCHFQAGASGEWLVGDRAYPTEGDADGGACLGLLRHRDERVTVEVWCRHDTSWRTQISHPHPVFGPDDRSIYFNSDRTGRAAVYRVDAPA